jgi:hypothetical protein
MVLLPHGAFLEEDHPIFTPATAEPLGVSPPEAVDLLLNQHHRWNRWYEEGPLKGPLDRIVVHLALVLSLMDLLDLGIRHQSCCSSSLTAMRRSPESKQLRPINVLVMGEESR